MPEATCFRDLHAALTERPESRGMGSQKSAASKAVSPLPFLSFVLKGPFLCRLVLVAGSNNF